jgi:hypothetical protein
MTESVPPRQMIHDEMERARNEFHALLQHASPADLARATNGTRWTNRQLLFHMLFGYLITRNLLLLLKLVTRLPHPAQRGFSALLNAGTRPFHQINYWGSRTGARVTSVPRMHRWIDRVIASLHRHLGAETDRALRRQMPFPTKWDPYFTDRMTVADAYHYSTQHFDFHRQQLTVAN